MLAVAFSLSIIVCRASSPRFRVFLVKSFPTLSPSLSILHSILNYQS